ncbi:E3 ubiquitin/ISG15 ligase TRIM25-like [Anomaloglossus baeobatrachus]
MASIGFDKELECSICQTLYTDPVTLRCGHNFCRVCIDLVLDIEDGSGVYSCPTCKEPFPERPALKRNLTLCNLLEKFWSNHEDDGSILCTYCVDSPVPADKSCLLCEASLCDKHLKVHSKRPEHVLSDPTSSLEKRKCSVHKEVLEYYCTEDAACICESCSLVGEHQGHKLESLDEAFWKKETLRIVLKKTEIQRRKIENKVQSLEELRRKSQERADGEAERVTALFIDMKRRVDDLEKRFLSEISRREAQVSLSLSDVIQKLEIKKDELSRKMRHIEELCNMTDPLIVLQDPDTGDLCKTEKDGLEEGTGGHGGHGGSDRSMALITHMSHTVSDVRDINDVTFYGEDPADILLDVNSADNNLLISDDLKTATCTGITQNRPETAERFLSYHQVMSRRGFTSGRHYWDVEIGRSEVWGVGMCYPSIDRSGDQSLIGNNNKSWGLYKGLLDNNQCSVKHNSKVIRLPQQISSDGVRVCLDYEAGQLSFYELCDPIRHLHTFTAAFSEPLHAALWVCEGAVQIAGGAAQ